MAGSSCKRLQANDEMWSRVLLILCVSRGVSGDYPTAVAKFWLATLDNRVMGVVANALVPVDKVRLAFEREGHAAVACGDGAECDGRIIIISLNCITRIQS